MDSFQDILSGCNGAECVITTGCSHSAFINNGCIGKCNVNQCIILLITYYAPVDNPVDNLVNSLYQINNG